MQTSSIVIPRIGSHWPEQGGIYAGIARGADGSAADHHLVLSVAKPDGRMAWRPACEWAQQLEHEGHADWSLPTRQESSLLFANVRDQFEEAWYWTSEAYDGEYAWLQYFDNGYQLDFRKSYEGRARAVRRLVLQSFTDSNVPERAEALAA